MTRVKCMEGELIELQKRTYELHSRLREEEAKLQQLCKQETGHVFEKERDDDYHRPGWYYTCKYCRFFTR